VNPLHTLRALAITVADLTQGVYAPVHCVKCQRTRSRISASEVEPLKADHQLPCKCGSYFTYVGGTADFVEVTR
jgi:hypothetical protein